MRERARDAANLELALDTGAPVTDAERIENLLRSRALQDAILNSPHLCGIATDERGIIRIFNAGAERMLGYKPSEVVNKITLASISDPQEISARAKTLSDEFKTLISPDFEALVFKASRSIEDTYELSHIRKNGGRLQAMLSVTALRDIDGSITGYLFIGTDNAARKQAETERQRLLESQERMDRQLHIANGTLHISEERLAVTLNSISDAVIATDAEARVTTLNPLAERLTGWTQAEATGRPVSDIFRIINQETRRPCPLPVKETLEHGTIQGLANHTLVIARNGDECAIADSCAPIRDREGRVIGSVLVFRDVTEEHVSQQAMRDNAARIQAILNTVVDGIITFHADDGIIETVNPAAEQIFGYSARELIGQNCIMLIPETDERRHLGFHDHYRAGDEPHPIVGRRKDGSIFPMEVAMSEMWLHGERHYTGIFRDITERHNMDKALHENYVELKKATAIAEKANLAKSEFLSRMSHELRTPLNAILGFAQLLEAGSPPLTNAQIERLHQITKAGWYLLELINEILDLAVIESGKVSLSPEPVSLTDVLQECHAMIESQAQKRGIRLNFHPFDNALFVNADRTRVKQVLINLLSNAIKYNCKHGTVEVECATSTPQLVRIGIKDTGAGLAPNMLSQLFQPFNRLGQENGAEEGTGMGLVVAKQLVELMGGTIGVKSTVGRGSEFWIELTRDVAPQFAAGEGAVEALPAHSLRYAAPRTLLYVEDNPANLMLVEQIVEGYPQVSMLSARDAHLGIALARSRLPDVILMDINLPGISGIEALKILRADPSTRHIPVLALSANAMPRDIEKGLEAGFFRYLTKPVKVNEFTGALNDALNLSRVGPFNESKTGRVK